MTSNDLIVMFSNLSKSLPSVQYFLGGVSYVFGIIFCLSALTKAKEIFNEGGDNGKYIVPSAYLLTGIALLYLPTSIDAFSTTLFGTQDNILAYSQNNQYDIYSSMIILIQTIGFVWFIRGCILLGHASQPQHGQEGSKGLGPKGLLFIVGGLFAINIYSTVNMLNYIINHLMQIAGGHQA